MSAVEDVQKFFFFGVFFPSWNLNSWKNLLELYSILRQAKCCPHSPLRWTSSPDTESLKCSHSHKHFHCKDFCNRNLEICLVVSLMKLRTSRSRRMNWNEEYTVWLPEIRMKVRMQGDILPWNAPPACEARWGGVTQATFGPFSAAPRGAGGSSVALWEISGAVGTRLGYEATLLPLNTNAFCPGKGACRSWLKV